MQGDNPSASGLFVDCCPGLTTCAGVSASEIDESRFDALRIITHCTAPTASSKGHWDSQGLEHAARLPWVRWETLSFGNVQGHVMTR